MPHAPLSMGCCRQKEYWTGLPFPPPRTLPNPGIKPTSVSPALQEDSLPAKPSDVSFMMLSGTQAPPAPLSLAQHCSFLKSPSEPFWSHPQPERNLCQSWVGSFVFFRVFFFLVLVSSGFLWGFFFWGIINKWSSNNILKVAVWRFHIHFSLWKAAHY